MKKLKKSKRTRVKWMMVTETDIFDIIGASLFTLDICYHLSFPMKLCGWYRILCISSAISLILEWFDINILKINHYICIVQVVVITGIMIAL